MVHNDPFLIVDDLVDLGRFKEAFATAQSAKLELQRDNVVRYFGMVAELSYYLGDFATAERASEKLLKEADSPRAKAIAHKVLGEILANQLDFEASLNQFSSARSRLDSDEASDTRANVELSYWGWFSGILPLENAETDFAAVRRAVVSRGKPRHFAKLR